MQTDKQETQPHKQLCKIKQNITFLYISTLDKYIYGILYNQK